MSDKVKTFNTEAAWDAHQALLDDIHGRWPEWMELAKQANHELSSPYMLVASTLVSMGFMAMLHAQVTPQHILEICEDVFDSLTDPEYMAEMAKLRDDKAEIMAYMGKLLRTNIEKRTASKGIN